MMGAEKLTVNECDALDAEIELLRSGSHLQVEDAEHAFGRVLEPLLRQEGFVLEHTGGINDGGIDFLATREAAEMALLDPETLAIQTKFYRNRNARYVSMAVVHAMIGSAILRNIGRAIVVSNCEFSPQSRDEVARSLPLKIELVGISDLKDWVSRIRNGKDDVETEVRIILRDLSKKLARLIASNPSALAHLEWRDVERVIAEIFDGLGFEVRLTPGSKDGGKDVILICYVKGRRAEYYVEVKHWRSSTKVGAAAVEKLLKVVVEEKKEGGLFLSTYGFTKNAFEQLTTIEKQKLRFGDQDRIVTFCQTYVKAKAGLWSPPENLSEVLSPSDMSGQFSNPSR